MGLNVVGHQAECRPFHVDLTSPLTRHHALRLHIDGMISVALSSVAWRAFASFKKRVFSACSHQGRS